VCFLPPLDMEVNDSFFCACFLVIWSRRLS
jgi:hypothetical protein